MFCGYNCEDKYGFCTSCRNLSFVLYKYVDEYEQVVRRCFHKLYTFFTQAVAEFFVMFLSIEMLPNCVNLLAGDIIKFNSFFNLFY